VTALAPGAGTTCTSSYTLIQADVDQGSVSNTAQAIADPTGAAASVLSATSTASVTTLRNAALSLLKTADRPVASAGDRVTYAFLVTNTGTVTLDGISVTETTFSGAGPVPVPACPGGSLAPGASVTCTATYSVTPGDVRAGRLTNTATADATEPLGVNPPASASSTAALVAADALAVTGVTIGGLATAVAALLLTGVTLLVLRRRGYRSA
jgi:uncharacterized repeat protein (TIGR01451 family)